MGGHGPEILVLLSVLAPHAASSEILPPCDWMASETFEMTRKTLPWILRCIRNRIPALIIMTLAHVASALFGVGLALGSKSVIDHAVAGDMRGFWTACGIQGLLILFLLLCHALARHLREKLRGELDRDWKRRLFHGLTSSWPCRWH